MTHKILIRPVAETEIEDAMNWYEKQRIGLGSDFLLCLEEGLVKIERTPEMFPVVYKNIRRLLIKRFPYGIFYICEKNLISVLAVFHASRNPLTWEQRG